MESQIIKAYKKLYNETGFKFVTKRELFIFQKHYYSYGIFTNALRLSKLIRIDTKWGALDII